MKNLIIPFLAVLLLSISLTSCKKEVSDNREHPCVLSLVNEILSEAVTDPPSTIEEWQSGNDTYFHVTGNACCDMMTELYDLNCDYICGPFGGFSGSGDGNCPNFANNMKVTVLWEDNR